MTNKSKGETEIRAQNLCASTGANNVTEENELVRPYQRVIGPTQEWQLEWIVVKS